MAQTKKAGMIKNVAVMLIAAVVLATGLVIPRSSEAAYEWGWKQSDPAGTASTNLTRYRYMRLVAPATTNMRVIAIGHKNGNVSTNPATLRLALYHDTDTNPVGATLIQDLGVCNFTNGANAWQWFYLTTPYDMQPNENMGIGFVNQQGSCSYTYTSGTPGNVAGYYTLANQNINTAFPDPNNTASSYTSSYAHHIVYVLYPTVSTYPSSLNPSTAGYTITGDGFEALDEFTNQNQPYNAGRATTSTVRLTQNNNWASPGTYSDQTVTAWNNTSITFTSVLGSLTPGATVYMWVVNSDGEHNATGIPVTFNNPSSPETYAGTATVTMVSNTQLNVSMPFTGDSNTNGNCTVEYNTSNSWPGTAAPCSPVSGASPRSCSITGLTSGNSYYVRVTYNDPDTVIGTNPQVFGPFVMQMDLVAAAAMANIDSANQISISAPFTGDVNGNSSTQVEYNTTNSWPGTVKCASITGSSPRVCVVNGLTPSTSYYFRVTHTDADGVTGTNPQIVGPITTSALPTTAPVVTLVTPGNWPTRSGQVTLKQKVAVNVFNPNTVGMTVSSVTLDNGSSTGGWGTVVSTSGKYGPVLPTQSGTVLTWTGPFNIPAREAVSFYCEVNVSVGASDSDYNMTATVNDGIFNQTASVPVFWSRRSYATGTYCYMGTEANPVYCIGESTPIPAGVAYPFSVEYRVPANSNSSNRYDWHGPTSTTQPTNPAQVIRVSIPAGWTNVTAPVTQNIWNGVSVSGSSAAGWTITGSISPGMAMGPANTSCGDFVTQLNFTATPPAAISSDTGYTFQVDFGEPTHSRLIEDYSTSCNITTNGTNRSALDVRGGFMVVVAGGDIVPPANISSFNAAPADNRVTLSWANPTTDQGGSAMTGFDGVLVVQTEDANLSQLPAQNVTYSVGMPVGNGWVVYASNGTGFVDGSATCNNDLALNNGHTYHYNAFSFDSRHNYSSGTEVTSIPFDLTPTGPVMNVTVTPGDRKNTINWTNPVECDFAGVTIRYSTAGFPQNRDGLIPPGQPGEGTSDGTSLAGTKLGGTPGAADSFVHSSLVNGTPYYYTIWAYDDELNPNWSAAASPSAYSSPKDTEAPGQITDLHVIPGSETAFTLAVQWTAPADSGYDPASGNATKYLLRFYDQPIDDTNWSKTWDPGGEWLPQPIAAGSTQSYTVTGLSPLHDYYFAMKTVDEVNNTSLISNNAPGTTMCNDKLTACDQCHQMPPQDGLPGSHPRATGNIGKHTLPIHAGAGSPEVCNVCHDNGNVWRNNTTIYSYNHQNYKIDMNDPGMIGNEQERATHTGGTFVPYTAIVYKFNGYSSGVGYKQITGYCTGTYCHGAGLSSPRWGIDNIVCGEYCHETPPATGKHVKHYHPGQHYVNFAPTGTLVSGYDLDDGTTGWSGTVTTNTNGNDRLTGGNEDDRYATYLETTDSQKTFVLPAGSWYITVCVGDSNQVMLNQTVSVSGDGGTTWVPLIANFNCRPEKHFDKTVDFPFTVTNDGLGKSHDMILKLGNGTDATRINYMIVNSTPEAPKTNNTILQNTATEYGFSCGKCHTNDSTQAGHTGHVNGAVIPGFRDAEIHFDANSFPKNPLGDYTSIFGNVSSYLDGQGFRYTLGMQCANLYCHGSTLHAGGSNNTPTWQGGYIDVAGASLCGACHDAGYNDTTPLSNISTGSHNKHVNIDFAYRFDCAKCHNHTVGYKDPETGKIPIIDKTHHVNGDVDVIFDTNDNTMKFGRYSTSQMTCYSVYCHSNGLLKNNEPFWATQYAEPVWGSGSKQCNYCHGTGTTDGHPDYANLSTTPNSHTMHREANGIGCSVCHYNTTRDNGHTVYTGVQPSLHVNGARNVTFNPAVTGGSFNSATHECTNTYCHGTTAPPRWGASNISCGTCHGDGLSNPNPGIGAHNKHNAGFYDTNTTIVTNNSSASTYDFSCRFCHYRRTHGGGQDIPGVQAAEVNFNLINPTTGYNNTGGQYNTGATVSVDGNNWPYTDGTCTNLKCHSNGKGGPPNVTPVWTGTLTCTGCHNGTANDTDKMSTGHHSKHVWSSVYRRNCHDCHYATVFNNVIVDKSKHDDGTVEVEMSPQYGGVFDTNNKTCFNVFCHSNGDPTAWNGPDSDFELLINWTSTNGTTCTTCHSNNHYNGAGDGVRTSTQTLSFNHQGHLTNYASRIGCTNCHNETAATNTSIQPTVPSVHNNGKKNVVFYTSFFNMTGVNEGGNGYWGNWNDSPVDGFCTVICHSDGNGGNPARFPNWSTPQGSLGCNGCHGAKGTLATGSHPTHVTVNNIGCGKCHSNTSDSTTADSPTINATGYSTYHVNGATDIALATGTWNNSSGSITCDNTGSGCHNNTTSPVWGTTATCIDCHGVTTTETDDFTYGNSNQATVNTTEYMTSGHGRTTPYPYTGNVGANLACTDCHSTSVAHNDPANPFRLMSTATVKPSQPDTLCAGCHSAIGNHDFAHVAQGTWSWTPKCIDCHDPHGDTAGVTTTEYNGAMIQGNVSWTASGTYGVPGTTEAVDFPANFARAQAGNFMNWSSFVSNSGANKGICRVCHTEASNTVFTRTVYSSHNSNQGVCTGCHPHSAGFRPASCDGCHGYPPNKTDNKQDNPGAVGAHDMHFTQLQVNCNVCHGHNGSGSQHNETGALSGYTSLIPAANVDIDLSAAPSHGGTPVYNGTPGSLTPNKTCTNIGCHYGVESKAWDCQP